MHSFAQLDRFIGHVPARVVNQLRVIDVGRGSEALYRNQLPGVLETLAQRARVASVTASSEIAGIVVPDHIRAERIIKGRARVLRTRSEQELAGYLDALDYLFESDWRPVNVGLLLHLHWLLFGRTNGAGGRFKEHDNVVVDRFRPVPAAQTKYAVAELVDRFRTAMDADHHHPVLLIGLFALDFSVIHPFEDGNGRVDRVMTNALLADAGYKAIRYASLEMLIADSADQYYQALLDSTHGWHSGAADPWPWLEYFVRTLAQAYRRFHDLATEDRRPGAKQARVKEYVLRRAQAGFRLADARRALPGISDETIRLVLVQLRDEGAISVDGVGRAAIWAGGRVES